MRYEISGAEGQSVQVEAVDWMMAMAKAVEQMGIEVGGWVCQTHPDGQVAVADTVSGRQWMVKPIGARPAAAAPAPGAKKAGPPPIPTGLRAGKAVHMPTPSPAPSAAPPAPPPAAAKPAPPPAKPTPPPPAKPPAPPAKPTPAAPAAKPQAAPPAAKPAPSSTPAPGKPPPPVAIPQPKLAPAPSVPLPPTAKHAPRPKTPPPTPPKDDPPPGDLAERLFELSFDLSMATDPNDACRVALDVILQVVQCEAGSVLRGGLSDFAITFVAVAGPASKDLLGKQLRFGQGLIGACFDLGITIQVNDVAADPRHASEIDNATGFRTRAVLCVPVRTDNDFFGAIQLLNPKSRFAPWHVDTVEQVAQSLALTLSGGGLG